MHTKTPYQRDPSLRCPRFPPILQDRGYSCKGLIGACVASCHRQWSEWEGVGVFGGSRWDGNTSSKVGTGIPINVLFTTKGAHALFFFLAGRKKAPSHPHWTSGIIQMMCVFVCVCCQRAAMTSDKCFTGSSCSGTSDAHNKEVNPLKAFETVFFGPLGQFGALLVQ